MAKFKVCIQQYVEMIAEIEVEAETPEAALRLAYDADPGVTAVWEHGDDALDVEAWCVLDAKGETVWER